MRADRLGSTGQCLLALYQGVTFAAAPLLRWHLQRRARRGKEDLTRLPERFGQASLARPDGPLIWLHAASVGESLSTLPLIERLCHDDRARHILLTTGTLTSARLMAARLPARTLHQFVPLDRRAWTERFLQHWRPDCYLSLESELWPNTLGAIRRQRIPAALVNGRLSARSAARWQRLPGLARYLLTSFRLVLAQSATDAEHFRTIGGIEVACLGNLKHAAAPLPADTAALADLRRALGNRPCWVAASTHPGEEAHLLDVHQRLARHLPEVLTLIVPRHPERGDAIRAELTARALDVAVAQRSAGDALHTDTGIYLADTMGELGLFFRLAAVAFIGGSLVPHGGHNPLEPARLGLPVLCGPHMENFVDMLAALQKGKAAETVADGKALARRLVVLLRDPAERRCIGEAAAQIAMQEADVAARVHAALRPVLPPPSSAEAHYASA
ncbi:MAG: 3-deoxy-D-manno-octulosonic acid transferase [Geminicoccaceae bacterium]